MWRSAAAIARVATASTCLLAASAFAGSGDRYAAMREELQTASVEYAEVSAADPFAGVESLSRGALVSLVLARNPTLDAARLAWEAALARYPQEKALADPMLSYSVRPRSLSSSTVDPGHDFGLSQAVPFPGKRGLRGERALAEADSAKNDLGAERVRIAALASNLFDEYWLSERALELNAQHLSLLGEAERVALSRYAAGAGTQQDVLAAQTEQAMLEHRGVELDLRRRFIAERINTLLRRPPELELPSPASDLEPLASKSLDASTLVASALERRPELRAIAASVRARESDVAIARREFLPDFTLRAGYETSWQENPLKPVVGIELNVPLQLGRRRAALDEAEARLAREKRLAAQLEDRVHLEVVSAAERVRESEHLLEIARDRRLPLARSRIAASRAAFASGLGTFLELVDAERALRDAELAALEARAGVSIRSAGLARAMGEIAGQQEAHQ